MPRAKDSEADAALKREIASRLRAVQIRLYGRRGSREMAASVGVPVGTWGIYVTRRHGIGSIALLRLITIHGISPVYLLEGRGAMFEVLKRDPPPSR